MIYKECKLDLFSVPNDYYLVQCISADFGMGKGIAVEFNNRFDMKNKLKKKYQSFVDRWDYNESLANNIGYCLLEDRVFNLITKRNYWLKPTYGTLRTSLELMKDIMVDKNITKIAMPVIGCGLDRLQWNKVSEIIKDIFKDTDSEILVCIK